MRAACMQWHARCGNLRRLAEIWTRENKTNDKLLLFVYPQAEERFAATLKNTGCSLTWEIQRLKSFLLQLQQRCVSGSSADNSRVHLGMIPNLVCILYLRVFCLDLLVITGASNTKFSPNVTVCRCEPWEKAKKCSEKKTVSNSGPIFCYGLL